MANDQLIRFYAGTGTDDRGRTIADVWRFSADELEDVHDYIQWLFPLAHAAQSQLPAPNADAQIAVLLGARDRAAQLLARLEEAYREHPNVVGKTTLQYWRASLVP